MRPGAGVLEFNPGSNVMRSSGPYVHDLFQAQADRTPNAVSATYRSRQLTYGAQNAQSNQLARLLRERGVGKDTPVAICMKRSLALPVALLGVLKAGAACMPLDPAYPLDRLAYMMRDSQAPIL